MGQPKKQRRKYERPFRPYDKERIEQEKKILQNFGLRRKHEIWRTESIVRNFRRRARELQASMDETKTKELFEKLNKLGLKCTKLEDILGISVENILERRLQTIVYKKKMTNSVKQSRQLIVHGHILVDDRIVRCPGYLVPIKLENKIKLKGEIAGKLIIPEKEELLNKGEING